MSWFPVECVSARPKCRPKSHLRRPWLLRARTLASGFVLGTLLLQWSARAQDAHPAPPEDRRQVVSLSFEEALARGAASGPDVTVATAPRASAHDAVRYADPIFTQVPVVEAQVGPRFSSAETTPELVVSLSQPVPLTNTGKAQKRWARAELTSVEKDIELVALDSAERAGQAWIDLAYAEELLKLRKDALEQAEVHLRIVQSRTEVGVIDRSDLALAQGEVASARSLLLDAEVQHYLAAHELSYVTGLSENQRADVRTHLSEAPLVESKAGTNAEVHPVLASAAARADASKQGIDYAKSQQVPTVSVGVQYQREGTGDQIVTGILAVPLALWRPWRFQEARQRAQYDQDHARTKRVELELKREIERASREQEHASAQYDLLKSTAVPPRRDSLRIALAKFEAGEVDFLHVSWAKRELLGAEERVVAALAAVHRAHLRLLRSTGGLREQQK